MNAYLDRDYQAFVFEGSKYFFEDFETKASSTLSKNWREFRILVSDKPYFQRPKDDLNEELFIDDTIIYTCYKDIECGKIISFHKNHILVQNENNEIRKIKYIDKLYKSKGTLK